MSHPKTSFIFLISLLLFPTSVLAGPKSTNYELQQYQFGPGGTDTTFQSTNYGLYGVSGQINGDQISSTNFHTLPGLVFNLQSPLPPAPTLVNTGGSNYNKLHLTVNYNISYGTIPSDILFAIAVSTNFSTPALTKYVQADHTLGTNPVWQSYSTWGGSSGIDIIGLTPGTTYYAESAAKQGSFTQTGFGPATTGVATAITSLSFSLRTVNQALPPFTIDLGSLTPGSVVTTTDKAQVSISTNAYTGALIYVYSANSGLKSTVRNTTINSVSSSGQNLTGVSQGYGARATSVSQSSGNMVISEPFNGVGNNVGPLDSTERIIFTTSDAPITSGVGNFEIQAKSSINTPPATDYADILTVIAAASF